MTYLKSRGYPTADADLFAREVVDPSTPRGQRVLARLTGEIGADILDANKKLDRAKLRDRIATNPALRVRVEEIMHPEIAALTRETFEGWARQGHPLGFYEATRLQNSESLQLLVGIIFVTAVEERRFQRIKLRQEISDDELRRWMAMQDFTDIQAKSHVIWRNDGSADDLHKQIDHFLLGEVK